MKNTGLASYRMKLYQLEKMFAEEWERVNTDHTGELDGHGVLDYILSENPTNPRGEVTERDRVVAATVIQWLGSPVGSVFVKKALEGET